MLLLTPLMLSGCKNEETPPQTVTYPNTKAGIILYLSSALQNMSNLDSMIMDTSTTQVYMDTSNAITDESINMVTGRTLVNKNVGYTKTDSGMEMWAYYENDVLYYTTKMGDVVYKDVMPTDSMDELMSEKNLFLVMFLSTNARTVSEDAPKLTEEDITSFEVVGNTLTINIAHKYSDNDAYKRTLILENGRIAKLYSCEMVHDASFTVYDSSTTISYNQAVTIPPIPAPTDAE